MAIKTTINIHNKILSKINYASALLKISRIDIIRILLKDYLDNNQHVIMFSPVKYQERAESTAWTPLHLSLQEDEYEYYGDFRKIFKKSLSLIVAESVKKYLHGIIKLRHTDIHNDTDRHRLKNYLFFKNTADGIIRWTCFWGLPEKENLIQYIT